MIFLGSLFDNFFFRWQWSIFGLLYWILSFGLFVWWNLFWTAERYQQCDHPVSCQRSDQSNKNNLHPIRISFNFDKYSGSSNNSKCISGPRRLSCNWTDWLLRTHLPRMSCTNNLWRPGFRFYPIFPVHFRQSKVTVYQKRKVDFLHDWIWRNFG